MDYEKKYKEALERAEQFSEKPYLEDSKGIVEYIFPELKESDDEKIRKALVEMVHDTTGDSLWIDYNVHKEDAIDWLEKQGEQKPVECCADKLWTEFQKQVAYLMASSYNREHEYTKGYVEWVAQSLLGYAKNEIEQNHVEWSDDDEAFLDDILCKVESNLLLNKDEKNWLKSLRPQKQWKPTEEQIKAVEKL